jgi:hypothetical protein
MTHPENSFIAQSLLSHTPPRPAHFASVPDSKFALESGGPLAGSRRVYFKSAAAWPPALAENSHAMRPATFTRLCDTKKFGMVEVRTASLSQLRANPAQGLQRNSVLQAPGS